MARIHAIEVVGTVHTPCCQTIELKTSFYYRTDDPLAITMTVSQPGQIISWTFARDLLIDALGDEGIAGVGDVEIEIDNEEDRCTIALHSEFSAEIAFPLHRIQEFVLRSLALIPVQREMDGIDIDSVIEKLLG